ncbi:MAG: hypothetical protein ACPLXL_01555 [Minisyncoccia bacterium]
MRDIEKEIIERISRQSGESNNPLFLEKIQSEWNKLKPKMKDFSDIYPVEEITADSNALEKIKEDFELKTEMGIVGEGVAMEGIYELEWVAPDIEVLPTSEYDDIKNGIDFVLRLYDKKAKPLYLGIDVTTSELAIKEKRQNILNFLRRGQLAHLKYFADPACGIKGKIDLPKIAIVLNPERTLTAQNLLLKRKERQELSEKEKIELNKYKEEVEKEITNQLQENIQNIKELIKKTKYIRDKTKAKIKKDEYSDFLNKYQTFLEKIKEEVPQ